MDRTEYAPDITAAVVDSDAIYIYLNVNDIYPRKQYHKLLYDTVSGVYTRRYFTCFPFSKFNITYSFSSYATVTWASTLTWPGITGTPASSTAAAILAEPPEL